jgi:uncharacterized protein YlxW (UPF0749 family)
VGAAEMAAAQEPGGPKGPVDASWLILQRLDDLRRAQDELRTEMRALEVQVASLRADLEAKVESVRTDLEAKVESVRTDLEAKVESVRTDLEAKIESVRTWSLGLLLLAILGLLAKLLLPGA